jgi:hypothetical protein
LATYLQNHLLISDDFAYFFGQILVIENLKKHLILALIFFKIVFFAINSQPKQKAGTHQHLNL